MIGSSFKSKFTRRGQGIMEFAVTILVVAGLIGGVFAMAHVFPEKGEEAVEDLSLEPERTGIDPESRLKRPPHDGVQASYAIWCATDKSLRFYKGDWNDIPYEGDIFNGRVVTNIWLDIEEANFSSSSDVYWSSVASQVRIVKAMNAIQPWHMGYWFWNMTSLTDFDQTGIDVSKSDGFYGTFYNCSALTTLDVSKWDTRLGKTFAGMFYGCSGLTELNLAKFNSSAGLNTSSMFQGCTKLTNLSLPSTFTCNRVTNFSKMFYRMGYSATEKWYLNIQYLNMMSASSYSDMLYGNSYMYKFTIGSSFSLKPYNCGLRNYTAPGSVIMLTDGYWYKGSTKYSASEIPTGAGTYEVKANIYGNAWLTSTRTGTVTKTATTSYSGTLTCDTSGFPTVSFGYKYQWYKNGTVISGATSKTYTFTINSTRTDTYFCRVSDSTGHWGGYIDSDTFTAKRETGPSDYQCSWTAYYYEFEWCSYAHPNDFNWDTLSAAKNAGRSALGSNVFIQVESWRNGWYGTWILNYGSATWGPKIWGGVPDTYLTTWNQNENYSFDQVKSASQYAANAQGYGTITGWSDFYSKYSIQTEGIRRTSRTRTKTGTSIGSTYNEALNAAKSTGASQCRTYSVDHYRLDSTTDALLEWMRSQGYYNVGTPTATGTYYNFSFTIS